MRTKIFFAMLMICLCGIGKLNAQEAPKPETTVIKTIQHFAGLSPFKAQIIIIEPGGFTDAINLEKVRGSDNIITNAQLVKKELDKWIEKGFKLEGFSENNCGTFWTETYILTKR